MQMAYYLTLTTCIQVHIGLHDVNKVITQKSRS